MGYSNEAAGAISSLNKKIFTRNNCLFGNSKEVTFSTILPSGLPSNFAEPMLQYGRCCVFYPIGTVVAVPTVLYVRTYVDTYVRE